jgi:phosphohistidine phosphatase
MKQLFLVRHAKSSWDHPEFADFDRPLNQRGERNAPEMAERLSRRGIRPDLIVTSPARRALETARVVAKALHYPLTALREEGRIYEAGIPALLDVIRGLDPAATTAMLVGHNPGLTDLCNVLTEARIDNVPTTGIATITLEVEGWTEVEAGSGRLVDFDYPKKPA